MLATTLALGLSACSDLPAAGPSATEVVDKFDPKGDQNPMGVKLVELTPNVADAVEHAPHPSLRKIDALRSDQPLDRIGPGDVLSISIYEAGPGLFGQARLSSNGGGDMMMSSGNGGSNPNAGAGANVQMLMSNNASSNGTTSENLPHLTVDRAGNISVPYLGDVHVAGHTPSEAQRILEARLRGKASQAQVVVNVAASDTNVVFISGDIKESGRYPLTLSGEKVLDMVALAGGPTHAPQDTLVKISRHGEQAQTSLTDVQTIATENIPVQPQDRIQVDYEPRTFLVFGATGRVAQVPFDQARVSLAEAVARSGGLDDQRADARSLFLFRFESPFVAHALDQPADKALVPIIYHIDLSDPQSLFLMQEFEMHDKDLIYVANARTVQLYKFLQLINAIFTPVVYSRAAAGN